ncbi:MAG: hypothetical protein AAGF54_15375 [Pseudomonadota bacterium]
MRRMIITWIAAWPTITGLLLALQDILGHWPLVMRTLVLTGLMVPTMTLVIVPILNILLEHVERYFRNPVVR